MSILSGAGRIMFRFPAVVSLAIGLALCAVPGAAHAAMLLPAQPELIPYALEQRPVLSAAPALARPVGMLFSGDALTFEIVLPRFESAVDVYLGLDGPNLEAPLVFREDGSVQRLDAGLVPWKRTVDEPIAETLLTGIKLADVAPGPYTFYAGVSPAGDLSAYYLWAGTIEVPEGAGMGKEGAALTKMSDCATLFSEIRERALVEMEETIDDLKEQVRLTGGCVYPMPYYGDVGFSAAPAGGAPESASQYSTTNVQVPGVDEADFVKNDGSHIYVLADGRFQIIDVWPPEQSVRVASVPVEGEPKRLFVAEDRALVYSSLAPVDPVGPYGEPWWDYRWQFPFMEECTYGYDCDFTGDGRKSKISIFDISNRSAPVIERELYLEGSYINSRRVGSSVHTVLSFPPISFPGVSYWPPAMDRCFRYPDPPPTIAELLRAFDELKEKNRQAILSADLSGALAAVLDVRYRDGRETGRVTVEPDCSGFSVGEDVDGQAFLSILSLDIAAAADPKTSTIVGRPGAVYASEDALYIASRQGYAGGPPVFLPLAPVAWEPPSEVTVIHKFSMAGAGVEYEASGVVKGKTLNQFSMDESGSRFRIATSSGWVGSPGAHSTVSVLEQRGREMVLLGQADNIAPTEDIRSVRFDGDRGFLVTFKSNDPLFALDMSNPAAPRVTGKLEIPGFSTYMHFMDEDHLLTIGYDAEDHGTFAYFQGIMLQIFDVSDMSAPALVHKEVIGTRGTTSEAATNHLAFNYFAPLDLLAIPATVCDGSSGGGWGGWGPSYGSMTFSGLMVYDVTVDGGFSYRDGIPHVAPGSGLDYELCGSWWTQSNSVVERSIFMDDYVFSIARDLIMAGSLNEPGNHFSVVNLISTAD